MPARTIASWTFLGALGATPAGGATPAASRLPRLTVGPSAGPPGAGVESGGGEGD